MGNNETLVEDMDSPSTQNVSRTSCFNNCCTCTSRFSLSKNPTIDNSGSATACLDEFSSSFPSLIFNTDFTNHESIPSLAESFSIFKTAYPQFSLTDQADKARAREFSYLSLSNHVCFDYIGHGLFTCSHVMSSDSVSWSLFFDIVYKSVSLSSQVLCENKDSGFELKIRERIFKFMNMSQEDYTMVFTANKSSAFKLLAETYSFSSRNNLLTVYDHESDAVETMVENAVKRGAICKTAEFSWPNLRVQCKKLRYLVERKKNKGLFVFPLQSSLTGARYSYLWMSLARENGWNVLLDASALGPKDMETLGLSLFQPDFIFCSFYKVFGLNPSGFGCLFIKKSSLSVLNESKNVGIVSLVPPQESEIQEIPNTDENREIQQSVEPTMALEELEFRGLDCADSLGLVMISNRAKYLVNWLVNALSRLKHPNTENGLFLVNVYGPRIQIDHGPALAFNVFDWKGEKIESELVQKLADRFNISLICGTLKHIQFSDKYKEEKVRLEEKISRKEGIYSGISVVNAYFGYLTNFEDVYRLWAFVSRFLDADFVEKERWRYKALNQKTIEI